MVACDSLLFNESYLTWLIGFQSFKTLNRIWTLKLKELAYILQLDHKIQKKFYKELNYPNTKSSLTANLEAHPVEMEIIFREIVSDVGIWKLANIGRLR